MTPQDWLSPAALHEAPALEMRGISKHFPGVVALDRVSLHLKSGEILAVMGENGAGKSTLLKILGGAERPDAGEIRIAGSPVSVPTVAAAKAHGVGLIHQELMLALNLTVAANLFLGSECCVKPFSRLDRKRMDKEATVLLERLGVEASPGTLTATLTTGQRQMVEICKALRQNARILVMDEPTASLALKETERLISIVRDLRAAGISILYVSHRLEEVFEIADRILVLRDGREVGQCTRAEASPDRVVAMMVGRALATGIAKRRPTGTEPDRASAPPPYFDIRNLVVPGSHAPATFEVKRGEILGFAGLVGAGRTELMQVIAGIVQPLSGAMHLDAKPYAPKSVPDAIRQGVYLVPEDRKHHGLILPLSMAANVSLPGLPYNHPRWRLDFKREAMVAAGAVESLHIRPPDIDRPVGNLSGGNQQKVVLAKWLAMKPRLLILDEPTRGIDVAARAEIYQRILELAEGGLTLLLVSSDLEEILALSDRVVVMRSRCIAGVLASEAINKDRIGFLMTASGGET